MISVAASLSYFIPPITDGQIDRIIRSRGELSDKNECENFTVGSTALFPLLYACVLYYASEAQAGLLGASTHTLVLPVCRMK